MKKILLLSALAVASVASFANDPNKYADVDGVTCTSLWQASRTIGNYANSEYPMAKDQDHDRCRTACISGDKMLIGYSHKIVKGDELNSGSAHIIVVDLMTGKYEKTVQCTLNGETIDELLAINQIGVDDFGHVWFTNYHNDFWKTTGEARPLTVYYVKDLESGECEEAFTVTIPEDEAEAGAARTDYYDLVGDVLGVEAGTVIMAASCENAPSPIVFGWRRDQGSSKFEPHMNDGEYVAGNLEETYPADQTVLNYGSMCYIVRDDEHSGELFYVDGYTTYPSLYDINGTLIESMSQLDDTNADCLPSDVGCNGMIEFTLGERNMVAYPLSQYNKLGGWTFAVAEMGEGQSFTGMKKYWNLPEGGLGDLSDGGMRIHSLSTKKLVDANGKEAVLLAHFKTNGGLGVYQIAEPGYAAGVNDVVADDAIDAPVEYFNLQGVRVANPAAGQLVIARQGNKATKTLVK